MPRGIYPRNQNRKAMAAVVDIKEFNRVTDPIVAQAAPLKMFDEHGKELILTYTYTEDRQLVAIHLQDSDYQIRRAIWVRK